jgi:aldose 1-epimerase
MNPCGAAMSGSSSAPARTMVMCGRGSAVLNSGVPHLGQNLRCMRVPLSASLAKSVVSPVTSNVSVASSTLIAAFPQAQYWQSRHQQARTAIGGPSAVNRTAPHRHPPVIAIVGSSLFAPAIHSVIGPARRRARRLTGAACARETGCKVKQGHGGNGMRTQSSGAWVTCAAAIFTLAAALSWAGAASAATVRAEPYGRTKDGAAVTAYTLTNDRGNSATILDMGATIAAVRVPDRQGRRTNVVLSFGDVAGWEALQHAAIMGRVANRILNGFTLDGVHYPLKPGPTGQTMHSATGYTGYGLRLWQVEPVRRRDGAAISMTLQSPDGDQGMPGNLKIRATYRFTNDNALRLDMTATTDKATPVNLTNHVYFNLGGATTAPVYDHLLQVNSQEIAGAPEIGVVGELRPVAGTPFDFTRPVRLRDRMALALGPQYAMNANPPGTAPLPIPDTMIRHFNLPYSAANGLDRVAATLSDPVSGRVLEVRTVEPSVHVYALPRTPAGARSDTGAPFPLVPALALETQHLPDSPNLPQFPSIILRPGETYRSTTIFTFKTDRAP